MNKTLGDDAFFRKKNYLLGFFSFSTKKKRTFAP